MMGCVPLYAGTVSQTSNQSAREPHVGNLFSKEYGKLLLEDTKHVFTSPARWEEKEWSIFGVETLAVVGTAAFLDKPLQKKIQNHRSSTKDDIADIFQPFGAEYSFAVLGAFELGGVTFKDDRAKAVAQDGLAASLISAGVITPSLKLAIGRSRPNKNEGAHHFEPFSSNDSFPSGHTTQAFAVASVISEQYDPLWVKITSYGVASLVGLARMEHNAHYASDVLAGAIIGTAVGRTVVHFNQEKRIQLSVIVDDDGIELTMAHAF